MTILKKWLLHQTHNFCKFTSFHLDKRSKSGNSAKFRGRMVYWATQRNPLGFSQNHMSKGQWLQNSSNRPLLYVRPDYSSQVTGRGTKRPLSVPGTNITASDQQEIYISMFLFFPTFFPTFPPPSVKRMQVEGKREILMPEADANVSHLKDINKTY